MFNNHLLKNFEKFELYFRDLIHYIQYSIHRQLFISKSDYVGEHSFDIFKSSILPPPPPSDDQEGINDKLIFKHTCKWIYYMLSRILNFTEQDVKKVIYLVYVHYNCFHNLIHLPSRQENHSLQQNCQ